ncbi:MAG: DUF2029 domain-containing protein [Patulibacter sp.]|nr:DUF2029 domain-containing protein [Patulibacter sp.]
MTVRALRSSPGVAWTLIAGVIAAVSLPFGFALAFDASAWVVWGRELWSLSIDTGAGPSWKPLPLVVTAPFAPLDLGAAAWLLVARAGALLAVIGAARLGWRTAGGWAAPIVVAAIVASPWWLLNGALGNADPLLGALVVWAVLAHVEDRPRTAFWLLVAGTLIRPEVWPFLAGYALWLAWRERIAWRTAIGAGTAVLALWVVPDLLSSGLESTKGATGTPSAGSAGLTEVPFLSVWADLVEQATWPVLLAALAAAFVTWRTGRPQGRILAICLGLVAAYVLLVATMAQLGFAGNPRYLVPALTLLAAVAGAVVLAGGPGRKGPAVVAVVVTAAIVVLAGGELGDQQTLIADRAATRDALQRTIEDAGGRAALTRCGPVRTDPTVRSVVAELLRESIPEAGRRARPGDATLRPTVDARGWIATAGSC